jgi:PleD family two-component response regulator
MLIKNSGVPTGSESLKITASIGVTMARKEDTAATLLDRVDKIMYAGKEAGRDRVFGDEVPLTSKPRQSSLSG